LQEKSTGAAKATVTSLDRTGESGAVTPSALAPSAEFRNRLKLARLPQFEGSDHVFLGI
jgi:hypothetical protein